MLTKRVFLRHDYALVNKARIKQAVNCACGFEQLKQTQTSYSSDRAASDYYLFRNLKSYLRGRRFEDNVELKETAEA